MSKIAWAGELELVEAKWTDKDGHTVKFRLVTPNEDKPNPFKAFTKRRGKRGGTRFIAGVSQILGVKDKEETYNGEFMLAGWSDTSTAGYSVTFWCEPPETGIHAFDGYMRNRDTFMAALVELDDDDQPIDQEKRARVESATTSESPKNVNQKPDRQPARKLSNYAALLCNNSDFWEWIWRDPWTKKRCAVYPEVDGKIAAEWMRAKLGIESRREIDEKESVAQEYHKVRKAFISWMEEVEA